MGLPIIAPLILAADREDVTVDLALGKGLVVPRENFLGDDIEPNAAHPGRRPGEVAVHDILADAHRLEDLRAAVALD